MKVLLLGVGTVGEAIARLSAGRPWLETMVLADHDVERAQALADSIGDPMSHPVAQIDGSDADAVAALAREHGVVLVMNALDPRFVMPVFRGALEADVDYLDMALRPAGAGAWLTRSGCAPGGAA
ncbi:saccharopine dehydrogenase NADP-binding domain-containing protein [Longivirga aurantiaca]|uniref:Saccharopine dehydrogenase NADP-binding domain-containing protein n=1 Tax=Longivirga aurantiaca TaxID=1837743 RepID=A0ABW1T1Q8_9ACTN